MRIHRMMTIVMMMWATGAVANSARAENAQSSIVFVDLDSVFTNYYKTKAEEAKLKEQADEVKNERKALIDKLDTIQGQYQALRSQAQNTALNEEARNSKRSEAEEKLIEVRDMESKINRLEESARRKIDEQSRRARKRLVDEINAMIRDHAIKKNYTAIIDYSGESLNGVPTVIYYNATLDITSEMVSLVNAGK